LDGKAREAIVKPLLTQDGVDSDFKSDMGRTPLPRPAANGYEAVVKLMLDTGKVNTEAKDTRYGRTPLLWAAENGYEAVVELLLGKDGVDPDSKSNSDWTPLSWAAGKEHKAVVKLLTDKGADVNANGGQYGSAFQESARGYNRIIKLLVSKGAEANARSGTVRQCTPGRIDISRAAARQGR
jgi:ankyrin repeat protein